MSMKLVLKGLILSSMLVASAQSMGATSCVKTEREIPKVAAVKKVVQKAGGIDNIEGGWQLTGLAGMVKHVEINIKSNPGALLAQIKGLDENIPTDFGEISACGTQNKDTLKINVIDAKATLFMRVVNQNTLQFAQIENGKAGQFHTFKKIQ